MAEKAQVEAKVRTIEERISAIMAEVHNVEKTGENPVHRYKYVEIAEVKKALREAMIRHGVIYVPRHEVTNTAEAATKNGGTMLFVTTTSTFRFYCSDNPSSYLESVVIGSGSDTGDKAAYKAMTGAEKYALLQTFCIPAGDDAETESNERAPAKGASRPVSIAKPAPAPRKAPMGDGNWELIEVQKAFQPQSGVSKGGKSWTRFDCVSVDEQKFSTFDHDCGSLFKDNALLEVIAEPADNYGKRKVQQARLCSVVDNGTGDNTDPWGFDEEEAV